MLQTVSKQYVVDLDFFYRWLEISATEDNEIVKYDIRSILLYLKGILEFPDIRYEVNPVAYHHFYNDFRQYQERVQNCIDKNSISYRVVGRGTGRLLYKKIVKDF